MAEEYAVLGLGIDSSGVREGTREYSRSVDDIKAKSAQAVGATAQVEKGFNSVSGALMRLAGFVGVGLGIRQLIGYTDQWKSLTGQLRLVNNSNSELIKTQQKLFDLAQSTRSPLAETSQLYSRVARSAKDLKLTNDQLLRVTESVNKSIIVSGTSASGASGALLQFGQALAAGSLRGDELISILEQTPRLAQAIAEGMGQPIGKLRELGKEGKLSSQAVVDALLSQSKILDEEYSRMPLRVSDAFTQIKNAALRYIGTIDSAVGASSAFAGVLTKIADNISIVVSLSGVLVASWVSRTIAPMVASALTFVRVQSQMVESVIRGNAVMLNGAKAAAMRAAAELAAAKAAAQSASIEAAAQQAIIASYRERIAMNVARNVNLTETIALTQLATAAEAELVAMTNAAAAAEARVAVTATASATATAALSVSARLAAAAMATLNGVLAFFGGPIGATITAVAAAIAYFTLRTTDLQKAQGFLGDKMDNVTRSTDDFIKSLRKADGMKVKVEIQTDTEKDAAEAAETFTKQFQRAVQVSYASLNSEIGGAQTAKFFALTKAFVEQKATLTDLGNELRSVVKEYPQFATHAKTVYNLAASMRAAQGNTEELAKATDDLADATTRLKQAQDAVIPNLKSQAYATFQLLNAVRTGGLKALKAEEQRQQTFSQGEKAWQEWADGSGTAAEKQLSFAQALEKGLPAAKNIDSITRQMAAAQTELEKRTKSLEDAEGSLDKVQKKRLETAEKLLDKMDLQAVVQFGPNDNALERRLTLEKEYENRIRRRTEANGGSFALLDLPELKNDANQAADAMSEYFKEAARNIQQSLTNAIRQGLDGSLDGFKAFASAIKDILLSSISNALGASIGKSLANVTSTFAVGAKGGIGGLTHLLLGTKADGFFSKNAKTIGALGGGAAGFGVGLSSGNALSGAVGGAAAGFATGGPLGAILGGVGGFVGGLFGHSAKAKAAAEKMKEATKAFTLSLGEYVAEANGTSTDLSKALAANTSRAAALKKEALDIYKTSVEVDGSGSKREANRRIMQKAYADIDAAQAKYVEKLKEEAALKSARLSEDLSSELGGLRLRGVIDPAAEQAFADEQLRMQQERRYTDAVAAGYTESQLATLKLIQAEEWLAVGRERATAAADAAAEAERKRAEDAKTAEDFNMDLLKRQAALSGDREQIIYAEIAAIQLRNKRELEAAAELLKAGTITQEMFGSFEKLLAGELADSILKLNDTSQEAADGIRRAAEIMRSNIASLNQESEVFGYSLEEQVRRAAEVYGFGNKSADQLRGMYTTYTPGQEISEQAQIMNDNIAEYLRLIARRDAAMASADPATVSGDYSTSGGSVSPNGTVYTGPVTVQISLNVKPEVLKDADRAAEKMADRVERVLTGRAQVLKSADGRL